MSDKSHSYLLGRAESEIEALRDILSDLAACVKDDLQRLPEGYRGREALERALRILKEQTDE